MLYEAVKSFELNPDDHAKFLSMARIIDIHMPVSLSWNHYELKSVAEQYGRQNNLLKYVELTADEFRRFLGHEVVLGIITKEAGLIAQAGLRKGLAKMATGKDISNEDRQAIKQLGSFVDKMVSKETSYIPIMLKPIQTIVDNGHLANDFQTPQSNVVDSTEEQAEPGTLIPNPVVTPTKPLVMNLSNMLDK